MKAIHVLETDLTELNKLLEEGYEVFNQIQTFNGFIFILKKA